MAKLTPTESWQSVALTNDGHFQCHSGCVALAMNGAPADDGDSLQLDASMTGIYAVPGGNTVFYRDVSGGGGSVLVYYELN